MRYKLTELKPIVQGYLLLIPVTYEKKIEKRMLGIIGGETEEISYDCECVLVKQITYEEIKKAIEETEMEFEERKKAIGLIPKTIKILTEPKYDLNTWEGLRLYRNYLLETSDWTQLIDSKVDKKEWAKYRQQLRDLPSMYSDIREIVIPQEPSKLPVLEQVAEQVAEPIAEPIAELIAEQVAEAVAEPVAEAVAEAVAEPIAEPVAEAVSNVI